MSITNKWEEQQYINKGGFSEVYRVKLHGKYYALKKIFLSVLKNAIYRESIEREISIMESLDHPRIIKLHQAIVEEDQISLLLQYAEGGSLHDQLKIYGKLPEHQVKQYIKDLIDALEYLHNRKIPILHRDIKPENLLIGEDHHCKLADFGSANILDGERMSFVGTPEYMAPEVVQRQPHGKPYDTWCVGILIYELLTGNVWKKDSQYPSFLSRAAEDVIKKLLVADQSKRMTIRQLKEHIWLCDDARRVRKFSSSKRINKLQEMKLKLKQALKDQSHIWKNISASERAIKKEKSVLEENSQMNTKSNEYVQLLKQRQKIKEQIMKNEKLIERQEKRRRTERPFLLQEIDRLRCIIKQYDNNINILKARPLKKEAECKLTMKSLELRVQDLTEYVSNLPHRLKADLLYFSDYESDAEIQPIHEDILKRKTQMLLNHRDALIELITSKKTSKQISEMIEIHQQFHMSSSMSQKSTKLQKVQQISQSSHDLIFGKEKVL